VALMKAMKDFR